MNIEEFNFKKYLEPINLGTFLYMLNKWFHFIALTLEVYNEVPITPEGWEEKIFRACITIYLSIVKNVKTS